MLYGNMQIRVQNEASRLMKEEPERFFMPEGNGMVSKTQYLDIIGRPHGYVSNITSTSTYGHSNRNFIQNVYAFDKRGVVPPAQSKQDKKEER